jgi:DNA-directed RNA polymerase subunit RPC12/RpoP
MPTPTPTTETRGAKAAGMFAGGLFGIAAAGCSFTAGLLLTLTGIGALVGIPLILISLFLPFVGALGGLAQIVGPCPHCSTPIHAARFSPGVDCPGCKRRVLIRDRQFVAID